MKDNSNIDWWVKLGEEGQEAYLRKHPNSKKAKQAMEAIDQIEAEKKAPQDDLYGDMYKSEIPTSPREAIVDLDMLLSPLPIQDIFKLAKNEEDRKLISENLATLNEVKDIPAEIKMSIKDRIDLANVLISKVNKIERVQQLEINKKPLIRIITTDGTIFFHKDQKKLKEIYHCTNEARDGHSILVYDKEFWANVIGKLSDNTLKTMYGDMFKELLGKNPKINQQQFDEIQKRYGNKKTLTDYLYNKVMKIHDTVLGDDMGATLTIIGNTYPEISNEFMGNRLYEFSKEKAEDEEPTSVLNGNEIYIFKPMFEDSEPSPVYKDKNDQYVRTNWRIDPRA